MTYQKAFPKRTDKTVYPIWEEVELDDKEELKVEQDREKVDESTRKGWGWRGVTGSDFDFDPDSVERDFEFSLEECAASVGLDISLQVNYRSYEVGGKTERRIVIGVTDPKDSSAIEFLRAYKLEILEMQPSML